MIPRPVTTWDKDATLPKLFALDSVRDARR